MTKSSKLLTLIKVSTVIQLQLICEVSTSLKSADQSPFSDVKTSQINCDQTTKLGQKKFGDFVKFLGLLKIYELYILGRHHITITECVGKRLSIRTASFPCNHAAFQCKEVNSWKENKSRVFFSSSYRKVSCSNTSRL